MSGLAMIAGGLALLVAAACLRAPQGWEDQDGFHYGETPEDRW